MNTGRAFKKSFTVHLKHFGQTTFIHSNFGTPQMKSLEVRGLKGDAENNRRQVVFQYPEQIEAYPGDVIQIKSSRDYWKIIDTEDKIQDDVYIYMEAWVEKINEQGRNVRLNEQGKAVFTGDNYGVVQMGGQGNMQNVAITNNTNPDFAEAVKSLKALIAESNLSELDKEDRLAEVERIQQLATKEQTYEVAERAKSKISLLEAGLKIGDLAIKAAPLVEKIANAFGG